MSLHAIEKAKERYNIDLTEKDIEDFIIQISNNVAKEIPLTKKNGDICPYNKNMRAFEVNYNDIKLPVLWQKHKKTNKQIIITIFEF